jgi:molybdopterin-guanine dinucleotide biosynthesis protein A
VNQLNDRTDTGLNADRISQTTGVILAGGASSRMGSNKALLPYRGGRFIESIHRTLSELFPEVMIVTNNPEQYRFIPCRKVPDLLPGLGALAGIHSALHHAGNPCIFAVACDMPYLNRNLIRHLAGLIRGNDVVIPESAHGVEPLHAFYSKSALPAVENSLKGGRKRIVSFFPHVQVRIASSKEVARFDPAFASFWNVNTPDDYFRLREEELLPLPSLNQTGDTLMGMTA